MDENNLRTKKATEKGLPHFRQQISPEGSLGGLGVYIGIHL